MIRRQSRGRKGCDSKAVRPVRWHTGVILYTWIRPPEASQRLCPYLCPSQSVVVVVIQAVLAIVVVTDGYAKSPTLVGNTRFDGNVGKSAIVIIMQKHDPGGILSLGVP